MCYIYKFFQHNRLENPSNLLCYEESKQPRRWYHVTPKIRPLCPRAPTHPPGRARLAVPTSEGQVGNPFPGRLPRSGGASHPRLQQHQGGPVSYPPRAGIPAPGEHDRRSPPENPL